MKSFKEAVLSDADIAPKIERLKEDVRSFANRFPMPGFDEKW